jgi:hypothetical protein
MIPLTAHVRQIGARGVLELGVTVHGDIVMVEGDAVDVVS